MTKTTAVRWWIRDGEGIMREFVLATDYATLQQRCRELEECIKLHIKHCLCKDAPDGHFCTLCNRALNVLGGEKGVGA